MWTSKTIYDITYKQKILIAIPVVHMDPDEQATIKIVLKRRVNWFKRSDTVLTSSLRLMSNGYNLFEGKDLQDMKSSRKMIAKNIIPKVNRKARQNILTLVETETLRELIKKRPSVRYAYGVIGLSEVDDPKLRGQIEDAMTQAEMRKLTESFLETMKLTKYEYY